MTVYFGAHRRRYQNLTFAQYDYVPRHSLPVAVGSSFAAGAEGGANFPSAVGASPTTDSQPNSYTAGLGVAASSSGLGRAATPTTRTQR